MKFIFASNNPHKIEEIKALAPSSIQIQGMAEAGFNEDIPETGKTLEENANIKARFIWEKTGIPCFADDTGLEVEALDNAPGVYSARFAGPQKNDANNRKKLLADLGNAADRKARFRTAICCITESGTHLFEGIVNGSITKEESGNQGFGYDSIFIADGFDRTFAEMSMKEKSAISHRGRAFSQLVDFLNKL
jgi:XTP/dITP diphosphohydrolase